MKALLISFVVAAMLLAPSASAQGKKQSAKKAACTNMPKAKRDFNAGHLAYHRGEYEEAVLKFEASYAACEKPLTLLAIGNAYERLGDLDAALEHLQGYRPHAVRREQADLDNRIEALEGRIADRKRVEEKKRKETERKAKETERKAKEEAARKAEEDRQRKQAEQDDAAEPLIWAGWISGAAGVAALAGSVVTGSLALSLDGDLADGCVEGNCSADQSEDIDRLQTLSTATDVLLVVGATMTAGGILMLLLGQPSDASDNDASTSVGFSLGPGLGGASLRRSF